jgi:preprotein translocase subunit SecF
MLSFYVIFQIPVDTNIIVTMLITLSYSLNASIIVFDRIRENRRYMPKAEFADVANISSNQTFMRNINTAITTLFPLGMIILLGVPSIRDFALPVAIGLIAGTFSSLFLAAPMWTFFRGGKKARI